MKMDYPPQKERILLKEDISKLDAEGFNNFINNIQNDSKFIENKDKIFTDEILRETFSKYFSLFKTTKNYKNEDVAIIRPYSNADRAFEDPFEMGMIDFFSGDHSSTAKGGYTFNERVYKTVMNLAHVYPDQVASLWELFWQTHGETSGMETLIDSLLDLVKDKKCSTFVNRVNFDMQYFYSFSDQDETKRVITSRLDFENEKNFGKTGAMLELLKRTFGNLDEYAEDNGVGQLVIDSIEDSLDKPGSYLLHAQAEEVLDILKRKKNEKFDAPFKMAKNTFALWSSTGLKIIDRNEYDKKNEALIKYDNFNKELHDKAINSGGNYTLNRIESNQLTNLQDEIYKPAGRDLEIQDIVYDKKTINDTNEALFDFECLQRRAIREKVEKDFNFSLEELTIMEQFQFLNFLKSKNNNDFKRVEFNCKKFGTSLVRTFLSIEQGG